MKPNEELLRKIGIVRKRWKAFIWARGLAWVLGVLVISLLLGLMMAESTDIPTWFVTALRLGLVVVFAVTLVKALVLPLRRVPDDTQLARFVEEKNPGIEDRLVSAVETLKKPKAEQGVFAFLLVKDALDRTKTVRFSDQVNKRKFGVFAALTGVSAVALILGLYISTLFFPIGAPRLLGGLLTPPAPDLFELKVIPGNVTVPRGSDVVVQVTTGGFDPRRAEIHLRYQNGAQWEVSTMDVSPQSMPTFRHLLFNLQEPVTYFVDADGHRSKEFTIRVEDLPRVEKLDYTYNYPAYTGLAPNKQESATDMIALKGTVVDVLVHGSQPLSGGEIVFSDGKKVPLTTTSEREVSGKVTIDRNATFRIKLVNSSRQDYLGLEEYSMEALEDEKPIVSFTKPGRDEKATNVQEVFSELHAEDDFGVNKLELYYAVNGGAEVKVDLFANKGSAPKEISGTHTFFLEEHDLKPGDFVTYYGKATDSRNPSNSVQTDLYFIEIRAFSKEYYQNQAAGGGGGGGGGGGQQDGADQLTKRQKEIIVATENMIRNKEKFKAKEYSDNLHAIAANQTKLIEQTDTLMGRLSRRGLATQNKQFKDLVENLRLAMEQMTPAAEFLQKEDPVNAKTPHEMKALQYLSRAEELFTEIQVTMGGGGGGGGGGGRQSAADLADLFELELDQSKNQYETVQRGEMQQGSQQVDEMLKKLQELAQRQQKLMERRAMQQQSGGSGGGDPLGAQEIQRETERLARQLEKLSRDNNDRQMADVGKALQQASQNMQRQSQGGNAQQQAQAAQQALDQIKRAQQMLSNSQTGNVQERLAQMQEQTRKLQQQQQQISGQTQQFAQNPQGQGGQERAQQLGAQQQSLAQEAQQLQQGLESAGNTQENREAASRARSAANSMKSGRLVDRMNQTGDMIKNGFPGYAPAQQKVIEQALADLEKQIGQAANASNNAQDRKLQEALNKASNLTRDMQSLQNRLNNGQQNQQGQQGQQGQGQEGKQGQQGQGQQGQGQEGKQGQQGQGQQGQGQQGQGQQGQGQQGGRNNGQQGGGRNYGGYGGAPYGSDYAGGEAGRAPIGGGDIRQIQREYAERMRQLDEIRTALGPNDPMVRDLAQIAAAMRVQMGNKYPGDPAEIQKLAEQIIDPLKNLELELSRRLEIMTAKDNVRSAKEDDVPSNYQKLVYEYYKRLASGPKPK